MRIFMAIIVNKTSFCCVWVGGGGGPNANATVVTETKVTEEAPEKAAQQDKLIE